MRRILPLALMFFLSISGRTYATDEYSVEVETEGSYRFEAEAAPAVAREVAIFSAKRNAADLAGRYLSSKDLVRVYELKKDEIYSLAAREINAVILEETQETIGAAKAYRVRIRAKVEAADFIKAEMEDIKAEKKEAHATYREEMEQSVPEKIDPGLDIAKAYRLQRHKKWRPAGIYLNHLEKKYPNWDRVHLAKALTHYVLHEPLFMKKALKKACLLGNQTACDDLEQIKKLHAFDFGLSISD